MKFRRRRLRTGTRRDTRGGVLAPGWQRGFAAPRVRRGGCLGAASEGHGMAGTAPTGAVVDAVAERSDSMRPTTPDEYRRRMAELGIKPAEPDADPDPRMVQHAVAVLKAWLDKQKASFTAFAGDLRTMNRRLREITAPLVKALAPGEFLGDSLRVRGYAGQSEDDRAETAERLLRRHFSRGKVFYPLRWESGVGEAFMRRVRESGGRTVDVWTDLAMAPLFDAVATIPVGNPEISTVKDVHQWVRRRIQNSVEKELLGHTQDSKLREVPIEAEPPLPDDILEMADQRVEGLFERVEEYADLLRACERLRLSEVDRTLLYYWSQKVSSKTLARRFGLTPDAVRRRIDRAAERLKKFLT